MIKTVPLEGQSTTTKKWCLKEISSTTAVKKVSYVNLKSSGCTLGGVLK